ncbi:MAG: pilus assembly protein TadG-related protein [Candidatus Dormibacteraeota bacterium]|nr:pilus assembly protein TadG-related protein [Candidatus Dormibacteraeota bacterium]
MDRSWLRKQSGQAVVLVAVAVVVLTAILALALDGGGIYLDRRQVQNAADSAALAGAELLMTVPPSYSTIHNQAIGNLVKNLPGTSLGGTVCSTSCPSQPTIGTQGGNGIGTINLGAGYYAKLSVTTSYTYEVTIWHIHSVAIAPIHGFQSTIPLAARAVAQNANLPYAVTLLQDKPAYSQFHDLNIGASTAVLGLQGGGGPAARGGVFSNAGIDPGSGTPAITFSPAGNAGDLWAVNEPSGDQTLLNAAGRVTGQQTAGTLPRAASHLTSPTYPEPAPPAASFNGTTVTSGTAYLCPGQYTNQINVQSAATAILFPGVYQVQAGGVNVQGTLRTLTSADLPISGCGQTVIPGADLGVIIEVRPGNPGGGTRCDLSPFTAGAASTITLTPSLKYFNINIYIETMAGWQSICTTTPLGTNVLQFSNGACFNIGGALYGPADNMVIAGNACGTTVGQVIAWTLNVNGSGTLNVKFTASQLPYMKGLTQ